LFSALTLVNAIGRPESFRSLTFQVSRKMCTEPNAIDLYLHLRLAEVAPKNHPDTSNRIETEDNAQQYKNRLRLGRTHVSRLMSVDAQF